MAASPDFINSVTATVHQLFHTHAVPHLKGAQPTLDAIPAEQWIMVGGGIIGGIIALNIILLICAPDARGRGEVRTWTMLWLTMCTVIHSWLEASFVFSRNGPIARAMDLYAAADFRYGAPLEAGTASMEMITALVTGPLCLLLAWAIIHNKSYRYPLQLVLSTCQMYGLAWFTAHPLFHPEPQMSSDPFLFWVIAVGLNAPWGIFPPILAYKAWKQISRQMAVNAGAGPVHTNGKKHK